MHLSSFNLHQLSFSTNIVIIAIIGAVVLYGLMAGHAKVRNLALSTYVGIVLAAQLSPAIHNYLSHNGHGVSLGIIKLALFATPIVLLEISRRHHNRSAHAGMIVTLILCLLTAGLIIGEGLGQMPPDMLKHITDSSIIAFEIYTYRLWLVAIVPLFIIAEGFVGMRQEKKH